MENLLEKIRRSWWIWILGAGLGIGVGWFFTGLDSLLDPMISPTPKGYYLVVSTIFVFHSISGILFLTYVARKHLVEKIFGLIGIIVGSFAAPLPVAFFAVYRVLPLLSDLSLVYKEETVGIISEVTVPTLVFFFVFLTTIIFLLIGKLVTRVFLHSPSDHRDRS